MFEISAHFLQIDMCTMLIITSDNLHKEILRIIKLVLFQHETEVRALLPYWICANALCLMQ